jgi:hypothetical protein
MTYRDPYGDDDPNEQRRKSLLDALGPDPAPVTAPPMVPSADNTGFVGGSTPTLDPASAAPTKYGASLGSFGVGGGYDQSKLANLEHLSPKYQVGRTLSHFDPNKGITPEVLAALNTLNLGEFSGSKDKLQVGGANLDPRWEGYTNIDTIGDFNPERGNNSWTYMSDNPNAPPEQAQMGSGGTPMPAPLTGAMDPSLGGDPLAGIQAAIAKFSQGGARPNLQALLAQLGR